MTTPSSTISLVDIQNEFGGASEIGINEYYKGGAYVPTLLDQYVPSSGAISFDDLRNKTKKIAISGAANTIWYNVDLRATLVANGWDQTVPVTFIIPATLTIHSKSITTASLIIAGSFPGGLTIINNGKVIGLGGAGGTPTSNNNPAAPGQAGGPAINATSSFTLINYGTIAGGGGGGGSGGMNSSGNGGNGSAGGGAGGAGGGALGGGSYYPGGTESTLTTPGISGKGLDPPYGGYGQDRWGAPGGDGGALGEDGNSGYPGYGCNIGPGVGGVAGASIQGVEYAIISTEGTLLGPRRFSSGSVIGFRTGVNTKPWGTYGHDELTNQGPASCTGSWMWGDPWGYYSPTDWVDDNYFGPLNIGSKSHGSYYSFFDFKFFGKNVNMNSHYSDTGLFVGSNSVYGVNQSVYDITKGGQFAEWCVEGWFYPTEEGASGSSHMTLINLNSNNTYYGLHIWRANGGALVVDDGVTARAAFTGGNNKKIPLNEWTHVVVERSGGDVYAYLNGTYVGKHVGMNAYPNVINSYKIGCLARYVTYHFCGYISNVRISKVPRYNYGQSNFNPPTDDFTVSASDYNTVLLACTPYNTANYDASNYRLTGRATGTGLSASTPGYSRDGMDLPGSDAPVVSTNKHPFVNGRSSVFFKGPGTVGTPWDTVGSDYRGYGILEFPGKPSSSFTSGISSVPPSDGYSGGNFDRIVIFGRDLIIPYAWLFVSAGTYYYKIYFRAKIYGVGNNDYYNTSGIIYELIFWNPLYTGGNKMVIGINTPPSDPSGYMTNWGGGAKSYIANATNSEILDFTTLINNWGKSCVLIGDSEGRNWTAQSGHYR